MFIITVMLAVSFPVHAASGESVQYLTGGSATDYVGITIDGNFDDWSDKPQTQIYKGSLREGKYCIASLFRDDSYIYLYVKMSEDKPDFNGWNYTFSVDGVEKTFIIVGFSSPYILDKDKWQFVDNADAAVTYGMGEPDECELKLPLSLFTATPDAVQTITFYSTSLGQQTVQVTGTTTLPFVIAGAGIIIASAGYGLAKRKRKK